MSSTTVTRGNAHEVFYIQPTFDNTSNSLAANTTTAVTYNVPGLQTSDQIIVVGYNGSQTAGVVIAEADCLTAGVLSVQYGNLTATATLKPASGVYTLQIIRLEGNPAPTNAA